VPSKLFAVSEGNGTREAGNFGARSIAQIRQLPLVWLRQINVENWLWLFQLGHDYGLQLFDVDLVVFLNGLK
jgi:hypothetical protein